MMDETDTNTPVGTQQQPPLSHKQTPDASLPLSKRTHRDIPCWNKNRSDELTKHVQSAAVWKLWDDRTDQNERKCASIAEITATPPLVTTPTCRGTLSHDRIIIHATKIDQYQQIDTKVKWGPNNGRIYYINWPFWTDITGIPLFFGGCQSSSFRELPLKTLISLRKLQDGSVSRQISLMWVSNH